MMQTVTLENLMETVNRQAPYSKSVKVKIIDTDEPKTYVNKDNEERQYKVAAIADNTKAAKLVSYDIQKFGKMTSGKSLVIRNFITKPNETCLVATTASIIHPPPAIVQALKDALNSPVKTRVSVKGKVIQEEVTHEVRVRNQPVSVKHIYVQDKSMDKCRISLWRDCAEADIKTGDYITVTNVVINNYKNETSLSTTSQTTVERADAPEERVVYDVQAASIDGNLVTYLLSNDEIISVPIETVKAFTEDDLEFYGRRTIACTYSGNTVATMEFFQA